MESMTETRTYAPAQVIAVDVLAEFGEQQMQREFADFVQSKHPNSIVDGWTVRLTVMHDGSDATFLHDRMIEQLNALPAKSMAAFS